MDESEKLGWHQYAEKRKEAQPRPWLVQALEYVNSKNTALDLGAGVLQDTQYLLEQGFEHVTAVDRLKLGEETYTLLPEDKVEYIESTFEEFDFPTETYDLINAQYSLPFNELPTFGEVFAKLKESLKPGGVFVGQLFGTNHSWNLPEKNMSFHTAEEVVHLLKGLEIISLEEINKDASTTTGEVIRSHTFHIIAQKK
jgi:tellurite methyltransferase